MISLPGLPHRELESLVTLLQSGKALMGDIFNCEKTIPFNLKGQSGMFGWWGNFTQPSISVVPAEQWWSYSFQTLHIYLDYYGERSRVRRTDSINNALMVILRQTTVYELLWLITISNATLHYCRKRLLQLWKCWATKRKCFNGNICKVLCEFSEAAPRLPYAVHRRAGAIVSRICVGSFALAVSLFPTYLEEGGVVHLVVFWLTAAFILSSAMVLN